MKITFSFLFFILLAFNSNGQLKKDKEKAFKFQVCTNVAKCYIEYIIKIGKASSTDSSKYERKIKPKIDANSFETLKKFKKSLKNNGWPDTKNNLIEPLSDSIQEWILNNPTWFWKDYERKIIEASFIINDDLKTQCQTAINGSIQLDEDEYFEKASITQQAGANLPSDKSNTPIQDGEEEGLEESTWSISNYIYWIIFIIIIVLLIIIILKSSKRKNPRKKSNNNPPKTKNYDNSYWDVNKEKTREKHQEEDVKKITDAYEMLKGEHAELTILYNDVKAELDDLKTKLKEESSSKPISSSINLFFEFIDDNGKFDMEFKKDVLTNRSIYCLVLDQKDASHAKIHLELKNHKVLRTAIVSQHESLIRPVIIETNAYEDHNNFQIKMLSPGKARKQNNYWVIEEKIKIKYI